MNDRYPIYWHRACILIAFILMAIVWLALYVPFGLPNPETWKVAAFCFFILAFLP